MMFWSPCNSKPLLTEGLVISTFRTRGQTTQQFVD
jgi:hypothetical protein